MIDEWMNDQFEMFFSTMTTLLQHWQKTESLFKDLKFPFDLLYSSIHFLFDDNFLVGHFIK